MPQTTEEPRQLYQGADGILYTMDTDEEVTCSWTATCERPANEVVPHPVLSGVPICTHHVEWLATQKR
jgi:hypothetical protein